MSTVRSGYQICRSSTNGCIKSSITRPLRMWQRWQSTTVQPLTTNGPTGIKAVTISSRSDSPFNTSRRTRRVAEGEEPKGERFLDIEKPLSTEGPNGTGTEQPQPISNYSDNQIQLKTDFEDSLYDPIFLRDSCACPKCVDSSTRQKLFSTTDIPTDIRVKDVREEGKVYHLTWENDILNYPADHVTTLSRESLRRTLRNLPAQFYLTTKKLWTAEKFEKQQSRFDYQEYMSKDTVLLQALEQLHTHGLVFISNVPETEASVSDVATRIGPLKNTFYGETWDVRSVAEAKNVAYTSQDLGFHMDLLYMHQPPRLQLLHCLKASTEGGTSLFSDAYQAANTMWKTDRTNFFNLAKNTVNFHYDNDSQHYHQSRHVIEFAGKPPKTSRPDVSGSLEAINWSPPFQGPFSNRKGDAALAKHIRSWHDAARVFRDLVEADSAVYRRQMPAGECVIFDNRRVLHARTAFSGGERWLRGAYVDSDPFLSKTRVLERRYGSASGRKALFKKEVSA